MSPEPNSVTHAYTKLNSLRFDLLNMHESTDLCRMHCQACLFNQFYNLQLFFFQTYDLFMKIKSMQFKLLINFLPGTQSYSLLLKLSDTEGKK